MYEILNECNTVQLKQPFAWEEPATSNRLVFLNELPLLPVYAETLPDGLIVDEI